MKILLVLGLFVLLLGLFFLWLALRGRNPKNQAVTVGELTYVHGMKNVKVKTHTVKNMTDYCYTYTVNGKQYRMAGTRWTHPRKLLNRITIVYQKGFPKVAYVDHYTGDNERMLAIFLLALGVICLAICWFVWN